MSDDSKYIVEKMLDFVYTEDYMESFGQPTNNQPLSISALQLHAQLIVLADRYATSALCDIAETRTAALHRKTLFRPHRQDLSANHLLRGPHKIEGPSKMLHVIKVICSMRLEITLRIWKRQLMQFYGTTISLQII